MNYIKVKLDKEALTNAIKNMSEHELLVFSTNYPQDYYSAILASKKLPKIIDVIKQDLIDSIKDNKLYFHTIQVLNSLIDMIYVGNRYYACDEKYLYISNTQPIKIYEAIECDLETAAKTINIWIGEEK